MVLNSVSNTNMSTPPSSSFSGVPSNGCYNLQANCFEPKWLGFVGNGSVADCAYRCSQFESWGEKKIYAQIGLLYPYTCLCLFNASCPTPLSPQCDDSLYPSQCNRSSGAIERCLFDTYNTATVLRNAKPQPAQKAWWFPDCSKKDNEIITSGEHVFNSDKGNGQIFCNSDNTWSAHWQQKKLNGWEWEYVYFGGKPSALCQPEVGRVDCTGSLVHSNTSDPAAIGCYSYGSNSCMPRIANLRQIGGGTKGCAAACRQTNPKYRIAALLHPNTCLCMETIPTCTRLSPTCVAPETYCQGSSCVFDAYRVSTLLGIEEDEEDDKESNSMTDGLSTAGFYCLVIILPLAVLAVAIIVTLYLKRKKATSGVLKGAISDADIEIQEQQTQQTQP
jgi:hypothetical protein